ncbi:hypothetical protein [Halobacillus halophilus]|uniref:hypothetical protein n=1 Tax=Halobacillus halophilus TaxID=1570 RepID=UPI001CD3BB98|nr:hypothetical protein [Halobacillus halophilus]MCA1010650.1 hypothetical protein [Halobacillus halophilus]
MNGIEKGSLEEKAEELVRRRQIRIKKNQPNQDGSSSLLRYLRQHKKDTKTLY